MSAHEDRNEAPWAAWVRKADSDLLNIANNVEATAVPWDTVCFHAQQAVEKFLKAWLIAHAQTPRRTHDLVTLLADCVAVDPVLAPLEPDCRRLTNYAIQSRYPDDVFEIGEADGRLVVDKARRLCELVRASLPQPEA